MIVQGVKALVDSGIKSVPSSYVQHKFDPSASEIVELPVVDLLNEEGAFVAQQIHQACKEWSAFQIVGHGVPDELMQNVAGLAHQFFNMPPEERSKYFSEQHSSGQPFRFGSGSPETWYDFLYHLCPPRKEALPDNIPNYWEFISSYSKQINAVAKKFQGLFSLSLGLQEDALEQAMGNVVDQNHTMRLNYYPPCPDPQVAIGGKEHSDPGSFTILQLDDQVEGLQILHHGEWKLVKPLKNALVMNIGDQMEIVTNGIYKSLTHRITLNASRARVSVASFYYPGKSFCVSPLDALVEDRPLYRGNTIGDYLKNYRKSNNDGR